ncbi:3815_t:CDS:2 [Funneliformis geosporum]|nr:3815_t:CDS:2 [Funneliformis geosporum]
MIDFILNRKKHSIILNCLLINNKDTDKNRFTIDSTEIKDAEYINNNWYSNLMQPPTFNK